MAYTNSGWPTNIPAGSDPLNTADDQLRRLRLDLKERLNDLVDDITTDPVVVKNSLSRMKAVLDSNLVIANNALQNIIWDTQIFDFGAMFAPPSLNITVPIDGEYLVTAYVEFAANVTGQRGIGIETPNGSSEDLGLLQVDAAAAGTTGLSTAMSYSLSASDTIQVRVFQDSGGNLNLLANRCGVSVFRIYGS